MENCMKFVQLNCCHQLRDFKAKMHQFDFGWSSAPAPLRGLTTLPRLLDGIQGAYF